MLQHPCRLPTLDGLNSRVRQAVAAWCVLLLEQLVWVLHGLHAQVPPEGCGSTWCAVAAGLRAIATNCLQEWQLGLQEGVNGVDRRALMNP